MLSWDIAGVRLLNSWAVSSPAAGAVAVMASESVIFLMGVILAAAAAWRLWRSRRMDDVRLAVRSVVTIVLALLTNEAIGLFWFRPRPFVVYADVVNLIAKEPGSKSFPSDHATAAFAMAFAAASHPRLFAVLPPLAVIVALGRLAVGVHFPTDVLAGAVMGFIWARAVSYLDDLPAVRRFWSRAARVMGLKI